MNETIIRSSVSELKRVLCRRYGNELELYIFGSVARNDYEPDSDIDVLVLLPCEVDTSVKEEVIDLAYDIELNYNVVFGIVVRSKRFWVSEEAAVLPFHQAVQKEALRV
jgi:predicted nucleotidyltransferase